MSYNLAIPERIRDFITIAEIEDPTPVIQDLFLRKFGDEPPTFGHHIVAFYVAGPSRTPISYLHLWTRNRLGYVGEDARMEEYSSNSQNCRKSNIRRGGLLRQTLLYCFTRHENELDAFFGHCGNARAKEVDLAAGFLETSEEKLLVRWNVELPEHKKHALINEAISIGDF
jgi:hypothetical protein